LNAIWNASAGRAYLAEGVANGEPLAGEPIEPEEARPADRQGEQGEAPDRGQTDHDLLNALEIRVHIPEGAVPKEGPSAGVAVAVALLSALTFFPVAPRVALSGEITLTGQVLPVGGLKEKLLAALREGVRTVVLPEEVKAHVAELPAELKRGLQFVYVNSFPEVLPHVLVAEEKEEEEWQR